MVHKLYYSHNTHLLLQNRKLERKTIPFVQNIMFYLIEFVRYPGNGTEDKGLHERDKDISQSKL